MIGQITCKLKKSLNFGLSTLSDRYSLSLEHYRCSILSLILKIRRHLT